MRPGLPYVIFDEIEQFRLSDDTVVQMRADALEKVSVDRRALIYARAGITGMTAWRLMDFLDGRHDAEDFAEKRLRELTTWRS